MKDNFWHDYGTAFKNQNLNNIPKYQTTAVPQDGFT